MDGNQFNNQNQEQVQPNMNQQYREVHVYHQAPVSKPGEGFGVASLVLGIIALVLNLTICCIPPIFILTAILGLLSIIFGFIGIGKKGGRGQGIAGVICSVVAVLIVIAYFALLGLGFIGTTATTMNEFQEEMDYYMEEMDY